MVLSIEKKRLEISLKSETILHLTQVSNSTETSKSELIELLVLKYLDQLEKKLQDLKNVSE